MSYGVGGRRGSDPELLWLWLWLAAAPLIRPLAWERPYAVGVVLKSKKKKKNEPYFQAFHYPAKLMKEFYEHLYIHHLNSSTDTLLAG